MTPKKGATKGKNKVVALNDEDEQRDNELSLYKFSDILRMRTIKIVVGSSEFHVHEELLCRDSEKFKKQLRGRFREAGTGEIRDCEEDPELMAMFFEYLYRDGWLLHLKISHTSQYILLARLYCLADRLMAKTFQDAVLRKFMSTFSDKALSDQEICELLLVVHTELPEREGNEYHLRNLAFWYAATRLSTLKNFPEFKNNILRQYPELGSQLLLWAGDSDPDAMPSGTFSKPGFCIKQEEEFY